MKKIFRVFKVLFFVYFAYLVIAIGLGFFGVINVIPLAPGWKLKTPNYTSKQVVVDFEQPIVYYQNDSLKTIHIEKKQNSFSKKSVSYNIKDSVYIKVKYPNVSFDVPISQNYSIEKDTYKQPKEIICLSDIEGNFDSFIKFLRGNKIINEKYEWIFGEGHLVLLGDYFDRGKYVNECLWLIYKLEKEAEHARGKVHFILGNHEAMNIIGAYDNDLFKYVDHKYFANAEFLGFEYSNWYSKNTELGRWLRTKNSIEKIGDLLFVHGGVSPDLIESGLTLNQINSGIRNGLDKKPENHSENETLLLRNKGPLWYRGLAREEVTDIEIDNILTYFSSNKIIIGHTVFDEVKSLYKNKVIDIDLNHKENKNTFGLLIKANSFYEVDDKSRIRKTLSLIP
ncbi:metallophosphoesterase [Winogradskyella sp. SYSU M77433]|uniref:metallophosphoesterase n=1 Tax=Winogradskyella sp. SYSU M77433 TaxID=3042722 RepID=UPI002480E100|nr:metallophosphoesterase [Winogradskyella sp. SYSU M77433]MDH7913871.1 metallophosphoesterase [Winogradskyella sp. SYSU M77433]